MILHNSNSTLKNAIKSCKKNLYFFNNKYSQRNPYLQSYPENPNKMCKYFEFMVIENRNYI